MTPSLSLLRSSSSSPREHLHFVGTFVQDQHMIPERHLVYAHWRRQYPCSLPPPCTSTAPRQHSGSTPTPCLDKAVLCVRRMRPLQKCGPVRWLCCLPFGWCPPPPFAGGPATAPIHKNRAQSPPLVRPLSGPPSAGVGVGGPAGLRGVPPPSPPPTGGGGSAGAQSSAQGCGSANNHRRRGGEYPPPPSPLDPDV